MNKKERVLKTLNCEKTDRPPLYDLIFNDKIIEHYSGKKLHLDNPEELKETVYSVNTKLLDAHKQFIRLPQKDEVVELEEGIKIQKKRWTQWKLKEEEYNETNLRDKLGNYIKSYQGWDSENQKKLETQINDYKELGRLFDNFNDLVIFLEAGCGGPFSLSAFCGGYDKFSYLLADYPELIAEMLEVGYQENFEFAKRIPEKLSPAVFLGEDIAHKTGTMLSPDFFRKYFFPRLKRIIEVYHSKGIKVMFHSDGNLMEIMDDLVDCDIDALNPIETLAGMDFFDINKIDFAGIKCWPELMKKRLNPCLANARFTDEGLMTSCEEDFNGALSMRILYLLQQTSPWFADLIHIDPKKESLYFWHCGSAPKSLCHPGSEAIVNKQFRSLDRCNTLKFPLKEGEVTIARVTSSPDNQYGIFAFRGKAIRPGFSIRGNCSEIIPEVAPHKLLDMIIEHGAAHHYAIIYGDVAEKLQWLAKFLDIDLTFVERSNPAK